MSQLRDAVIVDGVRTPVGRGKPGGALADVHPESVPGTTINRQCGSSQQAAAFAAQGVMAGGYDIVMAAGAEMMSAVRYGLQTMCEAGGMANGTIIERL